MTLLNYIGIHNSGGIIRG